jgi:hypothetical protein
VPNSHPPNSHPPDSTTTGKHRVVARRRWRTFRLRLPRLPAGPTRDTKHAPATTRPPALVRLLRRHGPYVVLRGGLATIGVVTIRIVAPGVILGANSAEGAGVTAPPEVAQGRLPPVSVTGSASNSVPPSWWPPTAIPASPSNLAARANAATPRASTTNARVPQPAPTRTTPPPPGFTSVAIQAEADANTLIGGAKIAACATCDGGGRVAYIAGTAQLVLNTNLPVAGSRTLTVTYETDGPRLIKVSANGTEIAQRSVTGTGWESPQTFAFAATLPAGPLHIAMYNDEGPAPDIDKVVIS